MHYKTTLKAMVLCLAGLGLTASYAHAADSSFPGKPIQLVIGYGAGGSTDVCFRTLARSAEQALGQPIVIENKPGAGSALSIGYLARQKPDGYTLAALSTGAVLNQFFVPGIEYDVMQDVTPIAMVAQYQVGVLVRADSPMKTLADVIEVAKKDPEAISYSTAGVGTQQHLTMIQLGKTTGAQWVHIPYKSGVEATTALIRGDVDVMAQTAEWVPFVRDGRLRLLNVFTEERMKGFEDAPTLMEAGYGIVAPSLLGLAGPKGMAPEIVSKIDEAFKQAMNTNEFRNCADQFGLKENYKNAGAFSDYLQTTINNWEPIIKELAAEDK